MEKHTLVLVTSPKFAPVDENAHLTIEAIFTQPTNEQVRASNYWFG